MMITKNQIKQIKSLELKKFRKETGLFVAEGRKIIDDLRQHFELVDLFEGEDARKASLLDTPSNMVGVFRQAQETSDLSVSDDALCIALDGVQNPGNVGTIIRLADWFGIEDIYMNEGCADVYNPKVVQATMGSLGRVKVHYCDLCQLVEGLPENFPVYGTFLEGENIYREELTQGGMIIMGNEGHGISATLEKHVNRKLYIPNYPEGRETAESLNVAIATAVICSEFRRAAMLTGKTGK